VARRSERVSGRGLLVVLGMMGRCPFGGQTWLYLNWLRGLSRLGHDVWYVEDDATWPVRPARRTRWSTTRRTRCRTSRVRSSASASGDRWAYRALYRGEEACHGLSRDKAGAALPRLRRAA
jgi:hypothetical protein